MPIEFDDSRVTVSGVDDRRGRGTGGLSIGGGVGVVGLVIYLVYALLGGQGTPSVASGASGRPAGIHEAGACVLGADV